MSERRCEYERCGKTFEPHRRHARFCSNGCRASASRARRAQEGDEAAQRAKERELWYRTGQRAPTPGPAPKVHDGAEGRGRAREPVPRRREPPTLPSRESSATSARTVARDGPGERSSSGVTTEAIERRLAALEKSLRRIVEPMAQRILALEREVRALKGTVAELQRDHEELLQAHNGVVSNLNELLAE